MTRRSLIRSVVFLILIMSSLALLWWRPALLQPADSKQEAMQNMPGMAPQPRAKSE